MSPPMMNVPLSAAVLMLSTLLFGMTFDVQSECQGTGLRLGGRLAAGGGRRATRDEQRTAGHAAGPQRPVPGLPRASGNSLISHRTHTVAAAHPAPPCASRQPPAASA